MREIKFRGKRIADGELVIGDLVTETYGNLSVKRMFIHNRISCVDFSQDSMTSKLCLHEVDPATVGQYTELITWNDKEIYSGDNIKFAVFDYNGSDTHYTGVVKFSEGEWQIWNSWDDEYYGSDGAFSLNWVFHQYDELEVIGNIYENPGLLKDSESTEQPNEVGAES